MALATTTPTSARKQRRARATATASGSPAVVVRVVPQLDPPCEETVLRPPVQTPTGMDPLPLEWLTHADEKRPPGKPGAGRRPAPTQPTGLPPTAHAAARRFVGMCVEILNGYRPNTHLRPLAHPKHFSDIADQLLRRTVRMRMSPGQAARHGSLVRVRRMLLCEPIDGVAEAAVVLEQGTSTWAMAVRLERNQRAGPGRIGWHCMLVQVI